MWYKKFLRIQYVILPVILIVLAMFYLLYSSKIKQQVTSINQTVINKPKASTAVKTLVLKRASYNPNLLFEGQIEAVQHRQLKAAISGYIRNILVKEGELIHKGQVLAEFDIHKLERDIAYQQSYIEEVNAKIEQLAEVKQADITSLQNEKRLLELQNRTIQRLENLNQKQLTSDAELDMAKANKIKQELSITQRQLQIDSYAKQLARLKTEQHRHELTMQQLKEELANCHIKAPYDGRVEKILVAEDDYLKAGEPLLTSYSLKGLRVKAAIPDKHISAMRQIIATKSSLKVVSFADEQYVDLKLDRLKKESSAYGIFLFDKNTDNLALGQQLDICINLPPVSAFAIPQSAIYEHNQIYLLKNNRTEAVTIKPIGYFYNLKQLDQIQVLVDDKTLQDGDILITSQLDNIYSGMEVVAANL